MNSVIKTASDSFLKIVVYSSETYEDLNRPQPYYGDNPIQVISITPVGTDKYGNPLFCYELKFHNNY